MYGLLSSGRFLVYLRYVLRMCLLNTILKELISNDNTDNNSKYLYLLLLLLLLFINK